MTGSQTARAPAPPGPATPARLRVGIVAAGALAAAAGVPAAAAPSPPAPPRPEGGLARTVQAERWLPPIPRPKPAPPAAREAAPRPAVPSGPPAAAAAAAPPAAGRPGRPGPIDPGALEPPGIPLFGAVPAVPTPPEIPGVLPVPGIGTAPPPAPALPDPPRVAALPEGDEFRILFASGSEAVPDAAAALLDGIAARLAAAPDRRAQLRAYADAGGGPAREARRMSLERALAVRAALAARGVRTTRVDVRGLGATAADGPPDRVDVVIVD